MLLRMKCDLLRIERYDVWQQNEGTNQKLFDRFTAFQLIFLFGFCLLSAIIHLKMYKFYELITIVLFAWFDSNGNHFEE